MTAPSSPLPVRFEEHNVREVCAEVPSWKGAGQPTEFVTLTAWANGEGWTLSVACGPASQFAELTYEAMEALVKLWRMAKRGGG